MSFNHRLNNSHMESVDIVSADSMCEFKYFSTYIESYYLIHTVSKNPIPYDLLLYPVDGFHYLYIND